MKYAVIDIGSNSVRLLLESDGKTLYKELNTTRLGEGIALTSKLSSDAMRRTASAIRDFKVKALNDGAAEVFAFATAAVRSATNGAEFVALVQKEADIVVDVISGEEEASVGLIGALGNADGGIVDIGGGSTEITLRKNKKIVYSKSVNIGAVRLFDLCGRDRKKLEAVIYEKIKEYGSIDCRVPVYGVGGTATSLAALALGLKHYDGEKVHGFVLTIERLETLTDELFKTSPEELVENTCVQPKRAEIIAGGAALLLALMKKFHIFTVTVSENDNLEGYLLKRLMK